MSISNNPLNNLSLPYSKPHLPSPFLVQVNQFGSTFLPEPIYFLKIKRVLYTSFKRGGKEEEDGEKSFVQIRNENDGLELTSYEEGVEI